jgi:carbonic anhydrase
MSPDIDLHIDSEHRINKMTVDIDLHLQFAPKQI